MIQVLNGYATIEDMSNVQNRWPGEWSKEGYSLASQGSRIGLEVDAFHHSKVESVFV